MSGGEKLFDAITGVREDLIEEALDHRFVRPSFHWQRMAALAACLLFVVGVSLGALRFFTWGCGGAAPNGAQQNSSTECAPGDAAPPRLPAGSDSSASLDKPQAPDNDSGAGGAEQAVMEATVLSVHQGYLLVEPAAGDPVLDTADQVEVPTAEVAELPALAPGDRVQVTFSGAVQETYPARLVGVTAVEKLEP